MNIYVEIMSIYGITFLVSMFVALIIWGLAKLVDVLPQESFSLKSSLTNLLQSIISEKVKRRQFLKDYRETTVEGSEDLVNYHHEHA